jgi:hypothetical protein
MTRKASSHENQKEVGGIALRCAFTKLVYVEELKPNPENHKIHGSKQLALYWKIITAHGWRRPIVVSLRSGLIVKGHGAYEAAKRNGATQVPVDFQHYDSAEQELADLMADNRLAEMAGTNEDKLRASLSKLAEQIDIELTGFSTDDLERLVREADDSEAEFPIAAKLHERYDYVLIATTNESDAQFLQTLCGVQTEKSYKNSHFGTGRVVPFERFIASLRENHHSINVQGSDHVHPPADSPGSVVRPGKPSKRVSKKTRA